MLETIIGYLYMTSFIWIPFVGLFFLWVVVRVYAMPGGDDHMGLRLLPPPLGTESWKECFHVSNSSFKDACWTSVFFGILALIVRVLEKHGSYFWNVAQNLEYLLIPAFVSVGVFLGGPLVLWVIVRVVRNAWRG